MGRNGLNSASDKDEFRMKTQFSQGLHDRIMRSDVKRYVNSQSKQQGLASWHVLNAAKYHAKEHGLEETYYRMNGESAALLNKKQESVEIVTNHL